jgi:Cu+-exporting ATPase
MDLTNKRCCAGGSLERSSEHPLAAAIVAGARERGVEIKDATRFQSITGKGVSAKSMASVAVGNRSLLDDLETRSDCAREELRATARRSCLCYRWKPAGLIGVADPIKDNDPTPSNNCMRKAFAS